MKLNKILTTLFLGLSLNAIAIAGPEVYPLRNNIGIQTVNSTDKVAIFYLNGEEYKKAKSFSFDVYEMSTNGIDQNTLVKTTNISVNPKLTVVRPGEKKVFKVSINQPRGEKQKVYRVIVKSQEVSDEDNANKLKLILEYGLPVFVEPTTPKNVALSFKEEKDYTVITNDGNASLEIKPYKKNGVDLISQIYLVPGSTIAVKNTDVVNYIKSIEKDNRFIP